MYIESVQLKNFRNYDSLELDLAQGTNIFYGNNAQGKTNILEALYLCGTTKSHKGSRDKDMIQFGKDESHIRMMVKRDELSYSDYPDIAFVDLGPDPVLPDPVDYVLEVEMAE